MRRCYALSNDTSDEGSSLARALPSVLVDEVDRVADRLNWPVVVVALPEHEPLSLAGNRVEEEVSVLSSKQLVLGHVEHEHLRVLELRRGIEQCRPERWIVDPRPCRY